jgi:hypothetical protein
MTYRNRVVALCAVGAFLLVTLVLGEIFSPSRLIKARAGERMFPGFTDAYKVELSGGNSKVILTRGSAWEIVINDMQYPASAARVGFLLQEIGALTRGSQISRDPAKEGELGFSGPDAVHLVISGSHGETLADLYAGKTPATGKGRYVRVASENDMYETAVTLSPYLTTVRSFWEDLKIFPADLKTDAVTRVSIKSRLALSQGKGSRVLDYVLTRRTSEQGAAAWVLEGGAPAAMDKVQEILNTLIDFMGVDFDTDADAARVIGSSAEATIAFQAGERSFTLFLGARREGSQYPCVLAGSSIAYLVPEWRVDQLLAVRESLTPQAR